MDELRQKFNQNNHIKQPSISKTPVIQSYKSFCHPSAQPYNQNFSPQINNASKFNIQQQQNGQNQKIQPNLNQVASQKQLANGTKQQQQQADLLQKYHQPSTTESQKNIKTVNQNSLVQPNQNKQTENYYSPKKFISDLLAKNSPSPVKQEITENQQKTDSLYKEQKLQQIQLINDNNNNCNRNQQEQAITKSVFSNQNSNNNYCPKKFMTDISKLTPSNNVVVDNNNMSNQRCYTEPIRQTNFGKSEILKQIKDKALQDLYAQLDNDSVTKVNLIMEQAQQAKSRVLVL